MNDKETYGIELELITTNFSKKMNELKNKVNDFSRNFNIGLKYDDKAESDIANAVMRLKKQLQELNNTKVELFPDIDSQLESIKERYHALTEERRNATEDRSEEINKEIDALRIERIELESQLKQRDKNAGKVKEIEEQIKQVTANLEENNKLLESFGTNANTVGQQFAVVKNNVKGIKDGISMVFNDFKKGAGSINLFKKSTSDFGKNVSRAFDKGISSIKRFAVALLGVRGIYGLLTKSVRSYLADHENLKNQFNAMISGIGNLLAPAIEYVLSLVSKLLSYVNAFVKMLTGVDLFAKGMESVNKSAKSTAKSVKEIKGGLAGIDEITNIANDTGSGGGADSPTGDVSLLPDVDLSKLDKLKDFLSKIFEPFESAWNKAKTSFMESIQNMVNKVKELFSSIGSSIFEVWTNGTGEEIIGNILGIFQELIDIIGNVGEALQLAWDHNNNGTRLIQSIANIFNTILKFVKDIGDSLKKWTASESFQNALDRIFTVLTDIFELAEEIGEWALGMYEKYLKPVIDDTLLPALSDVITAIGDIWNAVKPVVDKVVKIMQDFIEPRIDAIVTRIKGIIEVVQGVAEFISGVFTLDWEKAWNGIKRIFTGVIDEIKSAFKSGFSYIAGVFNAVWNGMKDMVSGPIDAILTAVEWLINKMIDGFNAFKRMLNKISFNIPDWVPVIGGKKFGFNFDANTSHVSLGRVGKNSSSSSVSESSATAFLNKALGWLGGLATGTNYVENEGLAYLHQGEAVIPKKFNDREYFGNNEETNDLLRELITTLEEKDTSTYLDGKVIGETAKNYINNQTRMLGRSVI